MLTHDRCGCANGRQYRLIIAEFFFHLPTARIPSTPHAQAVSHNGCFLTAAKSSVCRRADAYDNEQDGA